VIVIDMPGVVAAILGPEYKLGKRILGKYLHGPSPLEIEKHFLTD
jgi:hypothetical protein